MNKRDSGPEAQDLNERQLFKACQVKFKNTVSEMSR